MVSLGITYIVKEQFTLKLKRGASGIEILKIVYTKLH